jgi:hypothetical protein
MSPRRHENPSPGFLCAAAAFAWLLLLATAAAALAQASPAPPQPVPPDPRAARPERPSVATHAFTVAPGVFELEAGTQRQADGALQNYLALPFLMKIGLGPRVQLDIAPGWQRNDEYGRVTAGMTDLVVGVKWRVADDAGVLGTFAIQTTAALPTGSAESGTGTGETAVNLLAISSRTIGPVSLDLNVGYTHRTGDGSAVPTSDWLWTVSTGIPLVGNLGMGAEVYGIPASSGPAGRPPVVAFLVNLNYAITPRVIVDGGATFDISGFGETALFGGLTWNIGRAWGGR